MPAAIRKTTAYPCRNRRAAFTVVELLVVMLIVAILIALLLPALSRARELANRALCAANLHTWGLVAQSFAQDNHGYFPTSWAFGEGNPQNVNGLPSWLSSDPMVATQFPLGLNLDSNNQTNVNAGAAWLRYGTPYSTFLQYGGTGYTTKTISSYFGSAFQTQISAHGKNHISGLTDSTPIASANEGIPLPLCLQPDQDGMDPTTMGVDGGLPKNLSTETGYYLPAGAEPKITLAPWMICPSCQFTDDLFACYQPGDWGYMITTTYAYVAGALLRQPGNFQEYQTSGWSQPGIILTNGFNNNAPSSTQLAWGNGENKPATTEFGKPSDILAADCVTWGGGGGQGNLYLINHPRLTDPQEAAFENILYADGHVAGIDHPSYYDPVSGKITGSLTTSDWAEAHTPPLQPSEHGKPPVYVNPKADPAHAWVDTWNAEWAGWYFYWPNSPGGN